MNNGIVITDSGKFENIINNFNNAIVNIEKVFENENNNFKKIDSTDLWNSDLQKCITNKYNELSRNYGDIDDALKTLSNFMKNTLDAYKRLEDKLQSDMTDNNEQLDVNS